MKKGMLAGLFAILILILLMGNISVAYTKEALIIWFEKLVPSLFICMVIVRLLYEQQLFPSLLQPFRFLIHFLFHMDIASFSLVFSSLLLGFPTGAVLLDEQVKNGRLSHESANRILYTCSFATPGFILMTCGSVLYGSVRIGLKLLAIQWICGFLFLFLTRRKTIIIKPSTALSPPFMTSLSNALLESGKTLYLIGGYLMLFMTITSVFMKFLPPLISLPLSIFAEFSNGVIVIQSQPWSLQIQMTLTSMLLGFAGLCVHMQVIGMTSHMRYSYLYYFIWRVLQMLLCGLLAFWIFA